MAGNVTVNRCDFEGQGGHGLHALAAVAVTVRHSSFRHILGRGVYANGTRQLEVSALGVASSGASQRTRPTTACPTLTTKEYFPQACVVRIHEQ